MDAKPGVFKCLWAQGLLDYDELKGLDWEWQAMDGAMTKAPLSKEQTGPNPQDPRKTGSKAEPVGGQQVFEHTDQVILPLLPAQPALKETWPHET